MPATIGLVVGYFILFSATKAEGGVRTFGKILAIWIFVITAFIPIAGAYVTFTNTCPMNAFMGNRSLESIP